MEFSSFKNFSFDELLYFLDSPDAPKILSKIKICPYGCIKTSITLLSQISDLVEVKSNLTSFKKASNLLIQIFIEPLISEFSILKIFDSSAQIEKVQETFKIESNCHLLCKWWMVYLTILSETYKARKSQPNWNAIYNVWFTKEEEILLGKTYQLLENFYQVKMTLLRFFFSRQWFLQEFGWFFSHYLSKQAKQNIRVYFLNIIDLELKNIKNNKKKTEDKIGIFRQKMLKQLLDVVNGSKDDDTAWSSILSGHFSKTNTKYSLSHSVVYGDDGGFYALMNTIDTKEREMLMETGEIPEDYLKFCEINQSKSSDFHQIVIGQGSFGKIRIAISLTRNETSAMKAGQIVFVKKTPHFKKLIGGNTVSWNEILENTYNDYSLGDVGNFVFSSQVYDMTIIQPVAPIKEIHQKGYTFQKLVPVYDGLKAFSFDSNTKTKGKYQNQWEHQRSYLIEIFLVISKLLSKGICMTDIKPQSTLYDGKNFKTIFIDLARALRRLNRSKLTSIKAGDIKEHLKLLNAPEIKNPKENEKVDLTKCMTYSLGLFVQKVILADASNHPYKVPLSDLAQKMLRKEPYNRISVEEGLEILREIGRNEFLKNLELDSFILKLFKETHDFPMTFGLNPNVNKIEKSLISLMAAPLDPLKYEFKLQDFTLLKKDLDDFIYSRNPANKEKVFVLLGSLGSGKSTILQHCYLEYMHNWKEGEPIPIFINLSVEDEIRSQWKYVCKSIGFEKKLKFNLFSEYSCPLILFVDSFNEVANKINFVTKFLDDSGNNPSNKCIICCRSEFIQRDSDYLKYFQPQNSEYKDIRKSFIATIDKNNFSLDKYSKKYYQVWNRGELESKLIDPSQIIKVIKQKDLNTLMKTGCMIHLTLEALPQIFKGNKDTQITRLQIFKEFIKKKIDKVDKETQDVIMKRIKPQIEQKFHRIIKKAAFLLAEILHSESSTTTSNGKILGRVFFNQYLFDSNTPCFKNHVLAGLFRALDLKVEIRGAIPIENIIIGFSHESIKYYFLAQTIYKESLLNKQEGILSRKLLIEDKVLIGFLVDFVKEKKEFKNKLKEMVYKSREEGESKVFAASNAITILIAANVSLASNDLSRIRIKGANIRDGVFSRCNFSDADLTGAILENCKLDNAIFQRTIMTDIDLGVFPDIKTGFDVYSCIISPDGNYIAASGENGTMKLWDRASRNVSKIFEGHSGCVNTLAFSPNGAFILSGSDDKTIKLWDLASGELLRIFKGLSPVYSVAFSPDGAFILGGLGDKTIKLWGSASGNLHKCFKGHNGSVYSVAFSSDGTLILSGSEDNSIKLWDCASGNFIKTFEGHSASVNSLTFSLNGALILSGSDDNNVKLWDCVSGKLIKTFKGHSNSVNSVSFSPDGQLILSGSWDKTSKLWDRASGNLLKTSKVGSGYIRSVAFSPDGTFIISGSSAKAIKIWDCSFGNLLKTFEGHNDLVTSVAFSLDGVLILSGSYDKTMKLWDRASGNLIKTFKGHSGLIYSVAFSPKEKFILSGSNDKTIKLWDSASGDLLKTFESSASLFSVVFSPDGAVILSGSGDKTIKLWSSISGDLLKTLDEHSDYVRSVAFSPDGALILSGSGDKTIKLWDRASGNSLQTFKGHSDYIVSVAFSPDGTLILSGSNDKTIKLWNCTSGNLLKTFEGHSGSVNSVAFSPDGTLILSGSYDKTIKLWNCALGKHIKTYEGHSNSVNSIAFSKDGAFILSGSWDKTIKIWERVLEDPLKSGSENNTVKIWDHFSGDHIKTFEGYTSLEESDKNLLYPCSENSISPADFLCSLIISPSETSISCNQLLICKTINLSDNNLQVLLEHGGIILNNNLSKPIMRTINTNTNLLVDTKKSLGQEDSKTHMYSYNSQQLLISKGEFNMLKKKQNHARKCEGCRIF